MDQQFMQQLKKRLEAARQQLSREANRKAEEGRDLGPEGAQDPADRAEATYEREILFSQSENETQLLQMVNGALDRMNDGTYGMCLNCGRDIEAKRLEAVPWAHFCINCQKQKEAEDAGRAA
ncbi:MAG TPA: TraR/DksA family transcriptional regulator [Terriglobales bacterium]|nr:TraR/DksA family transcriptional regulator [Terriglobales bacterium]